MSLIRAVFKTVLLGVGFLIFYLPVVFSLSAINFEGVPLLQRLTGNHALPGGWGQSLYRFRELENLRNVDILFIGSSHAYRGFDTRLFQAKGYSAFNLGSTAQLPMNTYYLLKQYLLKIKPKLIIFELYPEAFSGDGYESTIDLLANAPLSWELFEMSLATHNPHAVSNFFGKIVRDFKYPLWKFRQKRIEGEIYVPGGYVETSLVRREKPDGRKREIKVWDSQVRYFAKILELAKKHNVAVIGVIQPLPLDYLQSVSNYAAVVADLRRVAGKYEVVILDFNNMMRLDPIVDYRDKDHLNKGGVVKFNELLLEKLIAARVLPRN